MEICKNGDLFDFMCSYNDIIATKSKGLLKCDVPLMKSFYMQIIDSLSLLHNKAKYAHMDLKLENILISNDGLLKLCDFGFAAPANELVGKILGT